MKKNIGGADRIIRVVLGIALAIVGFIYLSAWWGVALVVVGIITLGTGVIGWCGLYTLLGINTCKVAPVSDQSFPPSTTQN